MKKIIKLLINFCFMVNLLTNDSSIVFSLDNDNCYFKLNNYNFNEISLKINGKEIECDFNNVFYFFSKDKLLLDNKIEIYFDNKFYSDIYYKKIDYNVDLNKENNIYLDYYFYSINDLIVLNDKNNNFIIDKEKEYEVNKQINNKSLIKEIYLLIEIEKGYYKNNYNEFYKGYVFKLDNELNNEINENIYLPKNYNKNNLFVKIFFCLDEYYLYCVRNVYFVYKNNISIDIVDEESNYDLERKII